MSVGLEIHDAASTGDFDSLEEYLRSGKFDVNLKDEEWNNRTALHWACAKGYVECIRLLLDFGAVGTARTDTGWTPAHFAAETGKLTALRALYNANVSVGAKDKYGDTPKRIAEIYGHSECSEFLERAEYPSIKVGVASGIHVCLAWQETPTIIICSTGDAVFHCEGFLSNSHAEKEQTEKGIQAEDFDPLTERERET